MAAVATNTIMVKAIISFFIVNLTGACPTVEMSECTAALYGYGNAKVV